MVTNYNAKYRMNKKLDTLEDSAKEFIATATLLHQKNKLTDKQWSEMCKRIHELLYIVECKRRGVDELV